MKLRELLPFISYTARLQILETERGYRKNYSYIFSKEELITRSHIEKFNPELLDRELSDGVHSEGIRDGVYIHLYK